MLKEVLIN